MDEDKNSVPFSETLSAFVTEEHLGCDNCGINPCMFSMCTENGTCGESEMANVCLVDDYHSISSSASTESFYSLGDPDVDVCGDHNNEEHSSQISINSTKELVQDSDIEHADETGCCAIKDKKTEFTSREEDGEIVSWREEGFDSILSFEQIPTLVLDDTSPVRTDETEESSQEIPTVIEQNTVDCKLQTADNLYLDKFVLEETSEHYSNDSDGSNHLPIDEHEVKEATDSNFNNYEHKADDLECDKSETKKQDDCSVNDREVTESAQNSFSEIMQNMEATDSETADECKSKITVECEHEEVEDNECEATNADHFHLNEHKVKEFVQSSLNEFEDNGASANQTSTQLHMGEIVSGADQTYEEYLENDQPITLESFLSDFSGSSSSNGQDLANMSDSCIDSLIGNLESPRILHDSESVKFALLHPSSEVDEETEHTLEEGVSPFICVMENEIFSPPHPQKHKEEDILAEEDDENRCPSTFCVSVRSVGSVDAGLPEHVQTECNLESEQVDLCCHRPDNGPGVDQARDLCSTLSPEAEQSTLATINSTASSNLGCMPAIPGLAEGSQHLNTCTEHSDSEAPTIADESQETDADFVVLSSEHSDKNSLIFDNNEEYDSDDSLQCRHFKLPKPSYFSHNKPQILDRDHEHVLQLFGMTADSIPNSDTTALENESDLNRFSLESEPFSFIHTKQELSAMEDLSFWHQGKGDIFPAISSGNELSKKHCLNNFSEDNLSFSSCSSDSLPENTALIVKQTRDECHSASEDFRGNSSPRETTANCKCFYPPSAAVPSHSPHDHSHRGFHRVSALPSQTAMSVTAACEQVPSMEHEDMEVDENIEPTKQKSDERSNGECRESHDSPPYTRQEGPHYVHGQSMFLSDTIKEQRQWDPRSEELASTEGVRRGFDAGVSHGTTCMPAGRASLYQTNALDVQRAKDIPGQRISSTKTPSVFASSSEDNLRRKYWTPTLNDETPLANSSSVDLLGHKHWTPALHDNPHYTDKSDVQRDLQEQPEGWTEKPLCTVRVTGLGVGHQEQEIVSLYLENSKRSGGGEIEEGGVVWDEKNQCFFITFQERNDAQRVASRDHVLKGSPLHVEFCNELPSTQSRPDSCSNLLVCTENTDLPVSERPVSAGHKRQLLISGVPEGTTEDCLQNYLESITDLSVETVSLKEDSCAVVNVNSTEGTVDVEKIKEECGLQPLKPGAAMSFTTAPTSAYAAVLVKGLNPSSRDDAISLFFKNKRRNAGGPVTKIERSSDRTEAVVHFENQEDAENVVKKTKHRLDDRDLSVAFWSDKSDKSASPQLRQPTKTWQEYSKTHLDTVYVRGLKPSTSDDTISLYFKNTRRSAGGPVTKVQRSRDKTEAIVWFELSEDAKNVVKKENHRLDDKDLSVAFWSDKSASPELRQPPKPCQEDDKTTHDTVCVRGLKPSTSDDTISLYFKNSRRSAGGPVTKVQRSRDKTEATVQFQLAEDAEKVVNKGSHKLDDADLSVMLMTDQSDLTDHKPKAEHSLSEQKLNANQNGGNHLYPDLKKELQHFNKTSSSSSHQDSGKEHGEHLENDRHSYRDHSHSDSDVEDDQESHKQIRTDLEEDKIPNLKPAQIKGLKIPAVLQNLYKDYPGLQVVVHDDSKTATVRCPAHLMKIAHTEILALITSFGNSTISISLAMAKMFQKSDTQEWIMERVVKRHKLVCHFEVKGAALVLCAQTSQMSNIEKQLVKVFEEKIIPLDEKMRQVLKSPAWTEFKNKVEREEREGYPAPVLFTDDKNITIIDTPSNIAKTEVMIRQFFNDNQITKNTVPLGPKHAAFLKMYCSKEISELGERGAELGIKVTLQDKDITCEGPQTSLDAVLGAVRELAGAIKEQMMTFKKPGQAGYLKGPKGQDFLKATGKASECYIITGRDGLGEGSSLTVLAEARLNLTGLLQIVQGDITKCEVDAIVNAANKQLDHAGGVAKAIVEAGGKSIQEESTKHTDINGYLKEGDVFSTTAGYLPCKHVIHAVGPTWRGGNENENEKLEEVLKNILREADSKKLTSLAIPAISCGLFHFPVDKATRLIVKSIKTFFEKKSSTSLKKVVLIDLSDKTLTQFMDSAKTILGSDVEIKGRPTASSHRHSDNSSYSKSPDKSETGSPRSEYPKSHKDRSDLPVKIIPGEIAKAKADVIVCTCHPSLDLQKGVLSKSILEHGGSSIQQELSAYSQSRGTPRLGSIVYTSGGNLQCKMVFHLSLPRWRDDEAAGKKMQKAVEDCLKEASKKKFRTIAFPTLGTGRLGYPGDQAASLMFSAVRNYFSNTQYNNVQEVQIIVFPKDVESLQAFRAETGSEGRGAGGYQGDRSERGHGRYRRDKADYRADSAGDTMKVNVQKLNVMIKEGDILKESCDAIVNSSNRSLDLSKGVLSKKIKDACGIALLQECNDKRKTMSDKGVVMTDVRGSNLTCSFVIHVCAEHFRADWFEAVLAALKVADDNNISSLAIPALGTGGRGADLQELAMAMSGAVKHFAKNFPKSLKEVRIVLFQKELLRYYKEAFNSDTSTRSDEGSDVDGAASSRSASSPSKDQHTSDSVDIFIIGRKDDAVKEAKNKIYKHMQTIYQTKQVQNSLLGSMSAQQTSKLFQLQSKHNVSMELDKKNNSVSITGCDTDVMEAVSSVKDVLLSATMERHLAAGGPPVRWQYAVDKDKFKDFHPENVITIEAAFKKKESEVRFMDRHGTSWKMVFKDRKVYGPDGISAAVKRRDLLEEKKDEIPLPSHWEPMKGDNVKRVMLQPDSSEYKKVAQHFGTQGAIKKIERIQNPTLFQQFKVKKKELEQYNPKGTENEKRLFHGTPDDSIEGIVANGFNRSYCGRHGTALGAGVYFAADSSVSRGYAQGGHMFQARVLVGEYAQGSSSMRFAPNKPNQNRPFDSVANSSSNATVFVIFHDSQAYPEYLITFQ